MSALITNHRIVSDAAWIQILAFRLTFDMALAFSTRDRTPGDCITSGKVGGIGPYPVAILVAAPAHPIFACGDILHFYPARPKRSSGITCLQACARN